MENFCNETSVNAILRLIGIILVIAKLIIPFLIIIFGTMDLYKSITNKPEDLPKNLKSFALRIVAGIIVFFIPNIVDVFLSLTGTDQNQCLACVLDTKKCVISTSSNTTNDNNNTSDIANNTCANLTEDECNQKPNECEWKYVENYKIGIHTVNGNYCVNMYFAS